MRIAQAPRSTRQGRPRTAASARPRRDRMLDDVLAGLERRPRSIPSHYFYDARGSRLFQWITNLPDYYLTSAERRIFAAHGRAMVAPLLGAPCTVVDLGAGDGHKTRFLLQYLRGGVPKLTYAPVDVSRSALDEAGGRVRSELPGVKIRPVAASYGEALRRLRLPRGERKLVLFLGSSIGNLEHAEASSFLREMRRALAPGDHVIVGFDLVKPLELLFRAYDDPQGVTRAFNLNLLARLNRELAANFDLDAFRHVATWDPLRPAMESWLVAERAQVAQVAGHSVRIDAGERIQTEISCKYTQEQIAGFASGAGFEEVGRFLDDRRWFADVLWKVAG